MDPQAEDVTSRPAAARLYDNWFQRFLDVKPEDLALIIGELANTAKISTSNIKKARTSLPSFSRSKWIDVAERFSIPNYSGQFQLETLKTYAYRLPPSFHQKVVEMVWHTQDAFQEVTQQYGVTGRVRILDMYLVPIVALFQGRVVDMPDYVLAGTGYSTGGDVDHAIVMTGGVLFLVVELKHHLDIGDNVAELFLELLSAAEYNKKIDLADLRVHGLLTDLVQFRFYSYDPVSHIFNHDETIVVGIRRETQLAEMIEVTNKIFSILLLAYTRGVRVSRQKAEERASTSPEPRGSQQMPQDSPSPSPHGEPTPRHRTITRWELALVSAEQCLLVFAEPATTIAAIERQSTEALKHLARSVQSLPRVSVYTGRGEPTDLPRLARRIVEDKYKEMLRHIEAD